MTLAGRRSRDRPGPDGAPRNNNLDVRWGSAYQYLVTSHPDVRDYLWELLSEVFNMGQRAGRRAPDPFLRDPPRIAGSRRSKGIDPFPINVTPRSKGNANMPDALSIIPPKVRAAIYVVLIAASAILTPLIAADLVPSVWGTVVQSLLGAFGVFSGTMALANVTRKSDQAVVVEAYDAKHDET